MTKLLMTVFWMEFRRIRPRLALLLTLCFGFAIFVSTCDNATVSSIEGNVDSPGHNLNISQTNEMVKLIPKIGIYFCVIMIGFAIIITLPFRGKNEWESGQFQMIAMGRFALFQVEAARFISFLAVTATFCLATTAIIAVPIWRGESDGMAQTVFNKVGLILGYGSLSLVPLLIASGILTAATNTAFYGMGRAKLFNFTSNIGNFCFGIVITRLAVMFEGFSHTLLPNTYVDIPNGRGEAISLHINWDFTALTLVISLLFIVWSGIILDEVEA